MKFLEIKLNYWNYRREIEIKNEIKIEILKILCIKNNE